MRIEHKIFIPIIIAALALFGSCSSDDDNLDTQPPVITVNEPDDHAVFEPGGEIHLDVNFTDNVALASYKIDIHWAGDGHTHSIGFKSNEDEPWDYETSGTLSDTSDHIHLVIEIDDMIDGEPILEGEYDLGVIALDAAGNDTTVWVEIDIERHE